MERFFRFFLTKKKLPVRRFALGCGRGCRGSCVGCGYVHTYGCACGVVLRTVVFMLHCISCFFFFLSSCASSSSSSYFFVFVFFVLCFFFFFFLTAAIQTDTIGRHEPLHKPAIWYCNNGQTLCFFYSLTHSTAIARRRSNCLSTYAKNQQTFPTRRTHHWQNGIIFC